MKNVYEMKNKEKKKERKQLKFEIHAIDVILY